MGPADVVRASNSPVRILRAAQGRPGGVDAPCRGSRARASRGPVHVGGLVFGKRIMSTVGKEIVPLAPRRSVPK